MKENILREKNGITLIALIITVIVLLILAVVTISAVNEGNLFAHANNAATRYSAEAELENTMLSGWLEKMKEYDGEVEPFDWSSVYLDGVDTSATYTYTDGFQFTITFSDNGIYRVFCNGAEVETNNVKANPSSYTGVDGEDNPIFTYYSSSFERNINKMYIDSETGNLVCDVEDLGIVTYVKN